MDKKRLSLIVMLALLVGAAAFRATLADAATLAVHVPSSAAVVGQPFKASVALDTQGDDANAIQGEVVFPAGLLTLQAITDGSSPVSVWLESPTETSSGTVSFAGIIPGGFSGAASSVLSLILIPKETGSASINIEGVQLLRDDGQGSAIPVQVEAADVKIEGVSSSASSTSPGITLPYSVPAAFTPIISRNPNVYGDKYFLIFSTTDKGSGIDHYDVLEVPPGTPVGPGSQWVSATSPYLLQDQNLSSDIYVRAVNYAGNSTIAKIPAPNPRRTAGVWWWISATIGAFILAGVLWIVLRRRGKKGSHALFPMLFVLGLLGVLPHAASAATLSLSSPLSSVKIGQTFTVSLNVASPDQAMNAVSADISFPSDELRVISVSQAASIVNFWVQQPSFSNATGGGDVVLQGVVLSPGYEGASGNVVNIIFQAVGEGSASVAFSSASVLANDGKGTNILEGMTGKSLVITPASSGGTGSFPGGAPSMAVSVTPPIADGVWHNTTGTLTFSWAIPSGATGVWYDFATSSAPSPSLASIAGTTTAVSYDAGGLADGTWYFLSSAEENGIWSPVSSKKIMLDRTPPSPFTISRVDTVATDTQPSFSWEATDSLSGVSHYEVKIGDGTWFDATTIASNGLYILPPQSPAAARPLAVRAYDNAGNYREEVTTFRVATSGCPGSAAWCAAEQFAEWNWWWMLIIGAALTIAYVEIFRLLRWKRRVLGELESFKKAIGEDVKAGDSGGVKVEQEVESEIKKIDRL